MAEQEITARLEALRKYLRDPARDPHLSLEEIFRKGKKKKRSFPFMAPLLSYLSKRKNPGPKHPVSD